MGGMDVPALLLSARASNSTQVYPSATSADRVKRLEAASLSSVPIACARLIATLSDQYSRVRKDHTLAAIMVSLRGSQRVGRNRYRENEVFLRDFEVNRAPR